VVLCASFIHSLVNSGKERNPLHCTEYGSCLTCSADDDCVWHATRCMYWQDGKNLPRAEVSAFPNECKSTQTGSRKGSNNNGGCQAAQCGVENFAIPLCSDGNAAQKTCEMSQGTCQWVVNCPPTPVHTGCEYGGKHHRVGASFSSSDGCNTFSCTDSGKIACTTMACILRNPCEKVHCGNGTICRVQHGEALCVAQHSTTKPRCSDGSFPVHCIIAPCSRSTCSVEGAVCTNDYCGGCNAVWTKNRKTLSSHQCV